VRCPQVRLLLCASLHYIQQLALNPVVIAAYTYCVDLSLQAQGQAELARRGLAHPPEAALAV
jgi:hypothetical protein